MKETKLLTDGASADRNNHDARPSPKAVTTEPRKATESSSENARAQINQQPVRYSFAVPRDVQYQHPSVIPPSQILGNRGCPDVSLIDSEIPAEVGERPRINNALSFSSDADDKENHCEYRENIDDAENYASAASGMDLFCIYPSPAFSEEDMALGHTYSFGIESC